MVLKRLFLAVPVVLVFLLSLLLHSPAKVASSALPPGLQADSWGGSLLDGQVEGRLGLQPVHIAWDWHPLSLLRLSLGLGLTLQGPVSAELMLDRGPLSLSLDITRLRIPAGDAPWLGNGTVLPSWQGSALHFVRRHSGAWSAGEGVMTTAGGPLRLNLQGQVQALTLPPSRVTWQVRDDNLVGELRQVAGNAALATLTLTADHRIQWQVRDRLLRLKAGYVSQNDPDLVVLTVAEPL